MGNTAKFGIGCLGLVVLIFAIASSSMLFSSNATDRFAGGGFLALITTIGAIIGFVRLRGDRRKISGAVAIMSAIVFVACLVESPTKLESTNVAVVPTSNPENNDSATETPSTPEPTDKPRPTEKPETYEEQRKREKREFLASIDDSITADKISGNATKYVGQNVSLHCSIGNVPQQGTINALCGENETNIVLQYEDSNSVDQGQSVHVLGTVAEPAEGTNAFGGDMHFPTVDVKFME